MTLQEQVCTREQSVKLKELGIIQDGLFYYLDGVDDLYTGTFLKKMSKGANDGKASCAFTSAELGKMLAALEYEAWGHDMVFTSYISEYGWRVMYRNPRHFENPDRYFDTEAQSRADTLIFLLTEKLMTAAHANLALNITTNPRRKEWNV